MENCLKIFINHIDSYTGYHFSKFFSEIPKRNIQGNDLNLDSTNFNSGQLSSSKPNKTIEIYGTISGGVYSPINEAKTISICNHDHLIEEILKCNVIIYDITQEEDQIEEALSVLDKIQEKLNSDKQLNYKKIFILLSTVLTWACTPVVDPENSELPFTEDDFRIRRPHPFYKKHYCAEKTIAKIGRMCKESLSTYIVHTGINYGEGENVFEHFFRSGWLNAKALKLFGNGCNILPTIHILDLAAILENIINCPPALIQYILAIDESKNSLQEIIYAISKTLTTGCLCKLSQEDAFLEHDIKQSHYDLFTLDIKMEPIYIKNFMNIKWISEMGIVENITFIVESFKKSRCLNPFRMIILGPPASGKTVLSQQLSLIYRVQHINIQGLIHESCCFMKEFICKFNQQENLKKIEKEAESLNILLKESGDKENLIKTDSLKNDLEYKILETKDDYCLKQRDDCKDLFNKYQTLLDEIEKSKERNDGRIQDNLIVDLYRMKLKSKPCQNQGYILDGFPKTYEQAKELFERKEDFFDYENIDVSYDPSITPYHIFILNAIDKLLLERVVNLPENEVVSTHNSFEVYPKRLSEYRMINSEEETALSYFEEINLKPNLIDINNDLAALNCIINKITSFLPSPVTYGVIYEQIEQGNKDKKEAKLNVLARENEEKKIQKEFNGNLFFINEQQKVINIENVLEKEKQLLHIESEPLNDYLSRRVMPTLTKAIINCCEIRPDDAIDYIAEYIFKTNPQTVYD